MHAWQTVFETPHDGTDLLERFAVPGGWVYRSTQCRSVDGMPDSDRTESMVFVPDKVGG